MSKKEYLEQLEHLLSDISQEERQAAIEYFTDYLEDAGPDGEQEVMEHLGSPAQVAASVKEGLNSDNASGRWTERGYESGTEAGRYAVVKAGRLQKAAGNAGNAGNSGEPGNGEKKEKRRTETGRNEEYSWTEYRKSWQEHRESRRERKQRRGIGWLLILLGGILCIGIPLASVLGSVFAAIVAAVAAAALGGFAAALGLGVAGILLLATGIVKAAAVPGLGLMFLGGGFLCLAFAALALAAGIWMWGWVIPWAVRGFVGIFQKIFRTERRRK